MKIRVHIERLVLGLPIAGRDGARVQAAVQSELARLLASGGLSEQLRAGGAIARVRAPELKFAVRGRPDTIGRQIGQSVYRGMGRAR